MGLGTLCKSIVGKRFVCKILHSVYIYVLNSVPTFWELGCIHFCARNYSKQTNLLRLPVFIVL